MMRTKGFLAAFLVAGSLVPLGAAAQIMLPTNHVDSFQEIRYDIVLDQNGLYNATETVAYVVDGTQSTQSFSFNDTPLISFTEDRTGLLVNLDQGFPAEVKNLDLSVSLPSYKGNVKGSTQGMAISAFIPGALIQNSKVADARHFTLHAQSVGTSTPITVVTRWPKGIIVTSPQMLHPDMLRTVAITLGILLVLTWAISIPAYYMNRKKINQYIEEMRVSREKPLDK